MLLALSQCLLLVYLVTGLPESLVFLELLVVLAPKHYTDVVAPCFLTPGVQDDGILARACGVPAVVVRTVDCWQ